MRNPRHSPLSISHPEGHGRRMLIIPAISLLLLVAACGSSTEPLEVSDVGSPSTESSEAFDDPATDDEAETEAENLPSEGSTAVDSSSDGSIDEGGDPAQDGMLSEGLGTMVSTGADIAVFVDGAEHVLSNTGGEPDIVNEVDGDGRGGLVYTTAGGLFWAGVDTQHQVFEAPVGQELRLLDVADSSLGIVALTMWDIDGVQQLGGFVLDSPGQPAFVHAVSNDLWRTSHAALIGDESDQILLSGRAGDCLGLSAIDFMGQPVGVANLPLLTAAATDPTATNDVCSDREALVAAWGPDGIVVVVEAADGNAVRLTAYDTRATAADSWFVVHEANGGPIAADFIDIDVAPSGGTTAIVAQRVGYEAYRFDPPELLSERDSLYIVEVIGSAADARMVSLAPEFTRELANPIDSLMTAIEEESATSTEPSCGLDAYSSDHVAIDLLGDGTDELWNFGLPRADGGQHAYVMHGAGDPSACEETGALLGDEQLVFTSSPDDTDPAGWYCRGSGPYELVQWFGNAGTGPGSATVELQRFTPPDSGTVWSPPVIETVGGLDTPVPPELGSSTCPSGMQPR